MAVVPFSTPFNKLPLRKKIRRSVVLSAFVLLSLAFLAFTIYEFTRYNGELKQAIEGNARKLAMGAARAASTGDAEMAQKLLDALQFTPEVQSATLYLNDESVLAHYTEDDDPVIPLPDAVTMSTLLFSGDEVTVYEPLVEDGVSVGILKVQGTRAAFLPRLLFYMGIMLVVLLIGSVMAWVLGNELQRRITAPLEELLQVARRVTRRQDFSLRSSTFDQHEFGELSLAFNAMLDKTEEALLKSQEAEAEIYEWNATLEERVKKRTLQLEEANRELEAFSYSVSHDLRAPLRHVQGYAEMLERSASDSLGERPLRYLKTINEAAGEMGNLIDDLLAFSRMGRAEMAEEALDLNALIEQVSEDLMKAEGDRQIDWSIEPLPAVKGDAAMIRVVLQNLLGNAVKYTRKRETATIHIGSKGTENGQPVLFVSDNGAGFDMQYSNKLFGVFQRLHRQEEFEGTGIGLATVRRIISRHGGRVWAEAALDEGATFYFTLPLQNDAPTTEQPYERSETNPVS